MFIIVHQIYTYTYTYIHLQIYIHIHTHICIYVCGVGAQSNTYLHRYAREEVLGISLVNLVPNSSRKPLKQAVRQAVGGEEAEGVELSIIKANAVSLPANQRRVDLRCA